MGKNIPIKRRGLMFVLSSPSGAGKTTIAKHLLKQDPQLTMSISMTTRKRRAGEVPGQDYFFVSEADFSKHLDDNYFLESAKVFDHYYGTPKDFVEKQLLESRDVLFDIDWQGTQQLAQVARGDLVSVFLLPPEWGELERRLRQRAQDAEEVIQKRMAKASTEMSHWAEYDYVIVNDDLNKAVAKVTAILEAERQKRIRMTGLNSFVKKLIQKQ